MTLVRETLTVEEALDRVVAALTMKVAMTVTGRKHHYLRALSHPRKRESLTVMDMIKLDTAHRRVDGTTPIFDTVTTILRSSEAEGFAHEAQLPALSITMLSENAEAEISVIELTRSDAGSAALDNCEKQLSDALPIMTRILAIVRRKRAARATGPPPPHTA